MKKIICMFVLAVILIFGPAYAADTYKIDPVHSTIGFSVGHMMVSQVSGRFDKYEGTILYDPADLASFKVDVTIDAASINTNVQNRDEHLRGPDFFEVENFPTITFASKSVTADSITGDLTIKGVTKEVTIPVSILGPVKNMQGVMVIGITGNFKLNRQEYGIKWNKLLDEGGVAVGDEVAVNVSVEAQKQETS